jgi:hypothetical protein
MITKYHIIPSLSMLIARPRTLRVDGAPVKAKELSVVNVARLEDGALQMYPHPVSFLGEEYKEYKTMIDRKESVIKNKKLRRLHMKLQHAVYRWPPKLGTIEFGDYLASDDGMQTILWLCVGRHNKMKRIECDRFSKKLTVNNWSTIGKIAWGRTIEVASVGPKTKPELDEGIDWAYHFYELETKRGWTREYILQMPISHFLSSLSKPGETVVEMDDAPPSPNPYRFH